VATDPSSNHNRACDLHEPHTGNWLTKSPEYENWVNGSTRFLWLHGIPGSGKTVLASYIIKDVKQSCQNSPNRIAWAYYYCYFQREQDESSYLLRWVINQLCRQSRYIPKEVRAMYDEGDQPSTPSLMIALSAVLHKLDHVYLVVDALDESLNRQNLLDIIAQIATNDEFKKIRLMALSRKEIDIERALKDISTDLSLSNSWVDKDIRLYIQNRLDNSRKLRRWPKALKDEIETTLVRGAKGMYVPTKLSISEVLR
jgi:Cdc6-like AAA superfamily ATPase